MYKIAFAPEAEKEFFRLPKKAQKLIAKKILDFKKGLFSGDKPLKGKHKGKFRKRIGNYRIIYLKENRVVLITIIRIAHRKEVYWSANFFIKNRDRQIMFLHHEDH